MLSPALRLLIFDVLCPEKLSRTDFLPLIATWPIGIKHLLLSKVLRRPGEGIVKLDTSHAVLDCHVYQCDVHPWMIAVVLSFCLTLLNHFMDQNAWSDRVRAPPALKCKTAINEIQTRAMRAISRYILFEFSFFLARPALNCKQNSKWTTNPVPYWMTSAWSTNYHDEHRNYNMLSSTPVVIIWPILGTNLLKTTVCTQT